MEYLNIAVIIEPYLKLGSIRNLAYNLYSKKSSYSDEVKKQYIAIAILLREEEIEVIREWMGNLDMLVKLGVTTLRITHNRGIWLVQRISSHSSVYRKLLETEDIEEVLTALPYIIKEESQEEEWIAAA